MVKKILVAESDKTVQEVVSYFLKLEGFEVATAGDGVAALEEVERVLPEVILLDPGLAGINGIEVSRLIREKSQFKNIPILFLADIKMSEEVPSGYGVIHKPIDPTKMVNTIKEYIEEVQQTPAEQGEPISIEELLGWEVPEDAQNKEVVWQEGFQDVTGVSQGLFGEKESEVTSTPSFPHHLIRGGEWEKGAEAMSEEPEMAQPSSVAGETAYGVVRRDALGREEGVEADLRGRITDDMIENIVNRIARDIIERAVSEVVPRIAEEEIKREIERLKGEGG